MTTTLFIREGRRYRAAPPAAVLAVAEALTRPATGTQFSAPDIVNRYLRTAYAGLEHEIFGALWLDNRNRLIRPEVLFRGTIDGCSVHPREVVKAALGCNAAAVVLFHNHPSGDPTPSQADEVITRRLHSALALVDIRLLDHIVIGSASAVSFAERGLI